MYLVLLHSIICCINFSTLYILSPTIYNIACVNNTSPSGSAAVVKIFEFLSGFMEVSFIEMICSDQSAYTYIHTTGAPAKYAGTSPPFFGTWSGNLMVFIYK